MGRGGEVTDALSSGGYWSLPSIEGSDVPVVHRLTLGEGNTPLEPWASDQRVLLKREDHEPTGSHKDRAASFQVARAVAQGARAVVISSSGNAGIATSRYAALHNIPAFVFVHPLTDPAKLAAIDGATTTLVVTERAINGAKHVARELGLPNLRPSVHDDALVGYATLGDELAASALEQSMLGHEPFSAVVLCATSGATAVAVAEVLAERCPGIAVHFVQGEGNAWLVDPSAGARGNEAHAAAAGRLGVRRSRRAKQLHRAIAATGGRGHIASADAVARVREMLASDGIVVSDESAANLSVARELVEAGANRVVCVISGAPPSATGAPVKRVIAIDEHDALSQMRALLVEPAGGAGNAGEHAGMHAREADVDSRASTVAFMYTNLAPSVGLAGPDDNVIFAAATGSELAPLLRAAGQRVTLMDDDADVLANHKGVLSSAAVLATPHVQATLAAEGCTAVVPFKTSPRFERLAETLNLRVLASPSRLVRQLENKLELPRIAAAAGVVAPATRVATLSDELVAEARAGRVDLPAILQTATGYAGNGTELVRDVDELAAAVARAPRASVGKLAQVIAGSPVTVNGCVLGDGHADVLVGGVTRQLTGIAECTDAPFGSCGNDWSMPLEGELLQRVRDVGTAVGRAIAREGFLGLYGVDAVVTDSGDVFLIELNSRITANLSLQVELQRLSGGPTLFDAHLAAFDMPNARSRDELRARFGPAAVSPVHPASASIVLYHRNRAGEVDLHPRPVDPGAYRLLTADETGGSPPIEYLRPAWRFDQLSLGEFLVLPPAPQRLITPGAQLARIITTTRVARDTSCTSLTDSGVAIVQAVRALVTGSESGRLKA